MGFLRTLIYNMSNYDYILGLTLSNRHNLFWCQSTLFYRSKWQWMKMNQTAKTLSWHGALHDWFQVWESRWSFCHCHGTVRCTGSKRKLHGGSYIEAKRNIDLSKCHRFDFDWKVGSIKSCFATLNPSAVCTFCRLYSAALHRGRVYLLMGEWIQRHLTDNDLASDSVWLLPIRSIHLVVGTSMFNLNMLIL